MTKKKILIRGFESGYFHCIACGAELCLAYNGGELDSTRCCGRIYYTRYNRIDLIVEREK